MATTDTEGRFELYMERDKSDRIFYATATVEKVIELVTIIGSVLHHNKPAWITAPETVSEKASHSASDAGEHSPGNRASITINELTTLAAAFSMAQLTQNGVIGVTRSDCG